MTPARLVALVCVAQVCAQIGAYTWPALLPGFIAEWHITNAEAGWITGLFYAAYTVSVPSSSRSPTGSTRAPST